MSAVQLPAVLRLVARIVERDDADDWCELFNSLLELSPGVIRENLVHGGNFRYVLSKSGYVKKENSGS